MHRLFFLLIALFTAHVATAAVVEDLYQGQGAVDSQSAQEREAAAPDLLHQVLLKVVGDSEALANVDETALLADANRYIQQFQYIRTNDVRADLTQPDQLAVQLTFNQRLVNQAIQQLGLPIWDKQRPDVLLWIAIDHGNQETLLGSEDGTLHVADLIRQSSQRRGLPVLLPVMDLQDQVALNFDAIWYGDKPSVLNASKRYAAPVIVTARLSLADDDQNQIIWESYPAEGVGDTWMTTGNLAAAIEQGIGQLTDKVSRQFTQVLQSPASQTLTMKVSDVNDYASYARLVNYLKSVQFITAVNVTALDHHSASITLSFEGDINVLQRTLAFGEVIAAMPAYDTFETKQYRLLP
jgi:hypothetical protein